jgi:hypothetical protein
MLALAGRAHISSVSRVTSTEHPHFLVWTGSKFDPMRTVLAFVGDICIRERRSSCYELVADTFIGWSARLSDLEALGVSMLLWNCPPPANEN